MQTNTPISLEELSNFILNKCYPIGSLYWTEKEENPASLLGGGGWTQIKDKFILAAGDIYKKGQTGGEATHVLTVDEMPTHQHDYRLFSTVGSTSYDAQQGKFMTATQGANSSESFLCGPGKSKEAHILPKGSSQAHNNMPPYEVFYCWKRVQ